MGEVGLHKKNGINLQTIIAELKSHPESAKAGAIASFVGMVREDPAREQSREAASVKYLDYEAYEDMALKEMKKIRDEMLKREGVIDVSIHHIIDRVGVGEESILVAVLGKHRMHVFPVLEDAVERVKTEVPIWKKEITEKSSYWVASD